MTLRTSRRGVALLGAIGASLGLLGAGPASASTRTLELNYTCNFPLMLPQAMPLQIEADIPDTAIRGKLQPKYQIRAVAGVSPAAAKGLRALGATTLDGGAIAKAVLTVPGASPLPLEVGTKITPMSIPAAGGFSANATGETPAIVYSRNGVARITVGDLILQLTPRVGDGTKSGLEDFETECFQVPGQNNLLAEVLIDDAPPPNRAPSAPGTITAVPSTNSVSLAWPAATDPDGDGIKNYEVYQDGQLVKTVTGTQATLDGLSPSTSYRVKVRARDSRDLLGDFGTEQTVTTAAVQEQYVDYSFALSGVSNLRTLTQGPVPLKGSVDARLKLSDGSFEANLALANTRAKLTLIGLIPVTAMIGFVQSGQTTGSLRNGVLSTSSRMKIRLPQLYLFGAIPIAGPGTCQTRRYSQVDLKSTGEFFNPLDGGPVSGTYAISDLTGCGALNGIISPFAAGGGNTINLDLTPKPVA